jgi:sulfatase modifying factor 1
MRTRTALLVVAALLVAFILSSNLQAQPLVNIETVTVGDAGNGAVANFFAMGKYEVTIGQYTTFLNSVASVASDSHIVNLWNSNMATDLNIAGISRSGSGTVGDPYNYSVISPSGITPPGASSPGNRPIAYVSWFDAARFVNWLHNGATNGASTETGAYTLNGATSGVSFTKNAGATWWIPSVAQWFQAAYVKGGGTNAGAWLYPTQSDSAPGNAIGGAANQANHQVGGIFAVTQSPVYSATQNYLTDVGAFSNSASAYGTFDQGGNVFEWNDDVAGDGGRGIRGSAAMAHEFYMRNYDNTGYPDPSEEFNYVGFRVASVAEAPPTPTPTPSPTPIPTLTPVITSATAASGTVGTAFSYQIAASNTPTSFGAMGLPNGLSINTATGLISGTPTTAGTFNVSISATNSGGTGSATLTLTINKASQTIAAFNTVPSRTFGDAPFAVTIPAATSGLVVILSVKSGPATVSGNTVTLTGVGTVVLAANQAGNSNCNAAPEVTTSFTVSPSPTPTPTPSVVLTVEKTTSLSGQWQFDREINVGPMTNTNEFYRLKIRTEVK